MKTLNKYSTEKYVGLAGLASSFLILILIICRFFLGDLVSDLGDILPLLYKAALIIAVIFITLLGNLIYLRHKQKELCKQAYVYMVPFLAMMYFANKNFAALDLGEWSYLVDDFTGGLFSLNGILMAAGMIITLLMSFQVYKGELPLTVVEKEMGNAVIVEDKREKED